MNLTDPRCENQNCAAGAAPGQALASPPSRAVEADRQRRASPRVSLSAEVDFSSDTNFFTGFSTDLADGGLFIATLTLLPVGTQVALKFTVPGQGEIEATGEVRWIRVVDERTPMTFPGLGIRFVELDARSQGMIASFVAQREPMFLPD